MSEFVLTSVQADVFTIEMNRPDKRNAISLPMLAELGAAFKQANQTAGIRAVLLRGRGKAFSAGIDVTSFMTMGDEYGAGWLQRMRNITHDIQSILTQIERLEVPVIALLHGYCLGLALEIALACDIRLAAAGTQLGLPETRLGMIPDVGGTTRLTRLVGPGRAKELIFTGKQISAEQAAAWGIVNDVVDGADLDERAAAFIAELRPAAPLAVGMAKRVIDGLADIDRGLQLEGWAQSQLFASEDFTEAVQAFMLRRPPEFKGR